MTKGPIKWRRPESSSNVGVTLESKVGRYTVAVVEFGAGVTDLVLTPGTGSRSYPTLGEALSAGEQLVRALAGVCDGAA